MLHNRRPINQGVISLSQTYNKKISFVWFYDKNRTRVLEVLNSLGYFKLSLFIHVTFCIYKDQYTFIIEVH